MTTTKEALEKAQKDIRKEGFESKSERGTTYSLNGCILELDNFKDDLSPYWDQESTEWYLANFVRKEITNLPENLSMGSNIYPYTYTHRSRFYDNGIGYVMGLINLAKKLNLPVINPFHFKSKESFIEFLKEASKFYHPQIVLSVLAWKSPNLMNYYAWQEPRDFLIHRELQCTRKDVLETLVQELIENPNSRRAITPSFIYSAIDQQGKAGGIPPYQNYQILKEDDHIISVHQHRSMDVFGGAQLDIAHDIEWGLFISEKIGLPLKKIKIIANNLHMYVPGENSDKNLTEKTNIKDWLFSVTDGYNPNEVDTKKLLNKYQEKIDWVWSLIGS